eukprot:TRINITY_DN13361_c3_g1_i1.p1 TRINITY_DN13361_c3_g1~~TRINITY_DN13361_c3_g1_i1.p1  ORF type:complete len:572 (+),score=132.44 TRINITY_DN13361_c3_g1_i1:175-1890(+)
MMQPETSDDATAVESVESSQKAQKAVVETAADVRAAAAAVAATLRTAREEEALAKEEKIEDDAPPFQKKYFSTDMMERYEPLANAMKKVEESQGQDEEAFRILEEHWDRFMDFSWCSQWDGKKFDVVFYGASGYSGYLMMQYLRRVALQNENFTFALAGRTATKVAEMRDREFKGTPWEDTPIMAASYDDVVSIIDLVKSAHVVVNMAGPYMLAEGEVLVDACVWCKADYVDISLEVPWSMRLKELHRYALDAGVMVVPSACSSAYADLGVYLLAKKLREDYGAATRSAVCYCSGGGHVTGDSGGTLRTRAALSRATRGPGGRELAKAMADPFSLGGFIPKVDRNGVKEVDIQLGTGYTTAKPRAEDQDILMTQISEDKKLGVWRAPYVNAFFDTRTVRRSNMLQADLGNQPYGTSLNFMEFALLPAEKVAAAKRAAQEGQDEPAKPLGQYGMTLEEEQAKSRRFEDLGPSLEDMSDAWTGFFLHAESANGDQEKCSFVASDGYFETSRVAIETALCLRFDRSQLPYQGGVLTPSAAGGTHLVERLISRGVKFKMGGWLESSELAPPELPA